MSNFVSTTIVINDTLELLNSKIDFLLLKYCIDNNIAIHFHSSLQERKHGEVVLNISDNFFFNYCDCFLQPIIYTLQGRPLIENLKKDIYVLKGLMNIIMGFNFVEKIEMRLSYIEVDENDYEIYKISIDQLEESLLNIFLVAKGFPVVKVIIQR